MSIFKRLGMAIIAGVSMFIIMSVGYKLFMGNDNWLVDSAIWSATWALGHLIAGIFVSGMRYGIKARIVFNVGVIFIAFITLSFITGVILNNPNWGEIVAKFLLPFGLATYSNSKVERREYSYEDHMEVD